MKARAIQRIRVHRLFGTYDYDLSPSAEAEHPDRLIILYGDNGCGKTTILRILFHLLAPDVGQSHKTILSSIPFARVEVDFFSGESVWAERPASKLTGGFTIGIRLGKGKEHTAEFRSTEDGSIKSSPETNAFLARLRKLDLGLYFLTDDRTVRLAGLDRRALLFGPPDILEEEMILSSDMPPQVVRRRRSMEPEQRAQELLVQSLKRAEHWVQSQAVRAASQGESSVNALYGEILKRIARLPLKAPAGASSDVSALGVRIAKLETRSKEFSKYGLQPEFNGKDIMSIVQGAPPSHVSIVTTVLSPYIESVEKKLDAMAALQTQIDALIRLVNSFYTRKAISYEIHEGFRISTEDGKALEPQMLSSGERHLLLLFCNTIQALDRPSIFIIDEPEISLNIKWQRRLLDALMECAAGNAIQYLFATHSFELLAQRKNNAVRLIQKAEKGHGRKANN